MQRREAAVRLHRNVCDGGVAVTANAGAPQTLQAHIEMLGKQRHAKAAADAAAHFGIVVGAC